MYSLLQIRSTKSESLNNFKIQMFKWFQQILYFGHWKIEICLVFRYLNFEFPRGQLNDFLLIYSESFFRYTTLAGGCRNFRHKVALFFLFTAVIA